MTRKGLEPLHPVVKGQCVYHFTNEPYQNPFNDRVESNLLIYSDWLHTVLGCKGDSNPRQQSHNLLCYHYTTHTILRRLWDLSPVLDAVLKQASQLNTLEGEDGLEPSTFGVKFQCSNQLNYSPIFKLLLRHNRESLGDNIIILKGIIGANDRD